MLSTLDSEVTSTIFDEVAEKESENFVVVFRDSKVFSAETTVCQLNSRTTTRIYS
jgi:hypothetical protein